MSASAGLNFGEGKVDAGLDQLFSSSRNSGVLKSHVSEPPKKRSATVQEDERDGSDGGSNASSSEESETGAQDASSEEDDSEDDADDSSEGEELDSELDAASDDNDGGARAIEVVQKKRKRKNEPEIEDIYMAKLERESESVSKKSKRPRLEGDEATAERAGKPEETSDDGSSVGEGDGDGDGADASGDEDEEEKYEIPKHETQDDNNSELDKAARTVFLGNVSSEAISSKEALKKLKNHLSSFFHDLKSSNGKKTPKIESFRFRSVAFSTTSIPRKAAFAKKELMEATTRSTNAYVVYNSPLAAREAVKRLNGSVVLDRHLRVDGVAHPSPVDHRRCVFVGNLGFVDDESLILAAQEDEDDEDRPRKKKAKKQPADIEEGLWRSFAKAGKVESVRVVRDKTTRVGKGIAYVQFDDQVAVEKALQFDGKSFAPLLPRPLRVTRAKKPSKTANAVERQKSQAVAAAKSARASDGKVYNLRVDTGARTMKGRAAKLLGRAGAAQMKNGAGIKRPESFIFEGYRATNSDGKSKMNMKPVKSGKKGPKARSSARSSKRAAAYKAKMKQA